MSDSEVASDQPISWAEFLQTVPPGEDREVAGLRQATQPFQTLHPMSPSPPEWKFVTPVLTLQCDTCEASQNFECEEATGGKDRFLIFLCRNCRSSFKTFAVRIKFGEENRGRVMKYGESPPFGPRFPRRVLEVVGDSKELLLKGRQAENQGLGIGAFGYYRRVVDGAKDQLIEEILKVARKTNAGAEVIDDLEAAKDERSFRSAVDRVKHGIPERLRIKGHDPLTLLHAALSEGLHDLPDERCLELAADIRTVLVRLVMDVAEALREDGEVARAVGRLTQRKSDGSREA